MDFVWDDGGRAASGYVGLAGDCVTRSIAIATGTSYRDVYQSLGAASEKTPRNGVQASVAAEYLESRNWNRNSGHGLRFIAEMLPMGVVIVHLSAKNENRSGHFCTLIDRVIHDTWDASEDEYFIQSYWTCSEATGRPNTGHSHRTSDVQELTQAEFDKILRRLRALDKTANNNASTEAEKHNALRMMQSLMLRNNLTRDDIVDDDNLDLVQFTRMACPVNGARACEWEKRLAAYVTEQILPTTQWFSGRRHQRTFFWFYGPVLDVRNAISLFRELLLTIATSAQLQFRGHTRGSGASYAEGYVQGLPRTVSNSQSVQPEEVVRERTLIQSRTLALHGTATEWLRNECNIHLTTVRGAGRDFHDEAAASRGKLHGSKHEIIIPDAPRRIGKK